MRPFFASSCFDAVSLFGVFLKRESTTVLNTHMPSAKLHLCCKQRKKTVEKAPIDKSFSVWQGHLSLIKLDYQRVRLLRCLFSCISPSLLLIYCSPICNVLSIILGGRCSQTYCCCYKKHQNQVFASLSKNQECGRPSLNKRYFLLLYNKNIQFDFDDELKVRDVRYDNMTKITIKVQLFWRLPHET